MFSVLIPGGWYRLISPTGLHCGSVGEKTLKCSLKSCSLWELIDALAFEEQSGCNYRQKQVWVRKAMGSWCASCVGVYLRLALYAVCILQPQLNRQLKRWGTAPFRIPLGISLPHCFAKLLLHCWIRFLSICSFKFHLGQQVFFKIIFF